MRYSWVLGLLLLSACATTPGGGTLNERVAQIQEATRTICRFVPTISTVANILAAGQYSLISTVAVDICNAITTAPLSEGGTRRAYVHGVRIQGQFVRR